MLFHHRRWRLLSLLCVAPVIALASLMLGTHADAQTGQRCFPETGQCISGRIRVFWERNGGLPVFGFPITPQRAETTREGTFQAQWFERHRLELHPENQPPYDVQIGRAGDIRLQQQGRDWFTFPRADEATRNRSDCHFFPETGHNVCGSFLRRWREIGVELDGRPGLTERENLAFLGLPLSGEMQETSANGEVRLVQWFERGRIELHPQNPAPYDVQLGLLGREIQEASVALQASQAGGTAPAPETSAPPPPTATPTPTATPAPVARPAAPSIPSGVRIGAICRDGTRSNATGRGACSHHGGVARWLYR